MRSPESLSEQRETKLFKAFWILIMDFFHLPAEGLTHLLEA
jgi:hypothetical protein